jgi:hypothetical protein
MLAGIVCDKERNSVPRVSLQVLAIVLVAFTFYFVWDFSQRVVTSIRLDQSAQQAQVAVDHALATQTALVERNTLVKSPQYVETVVRGWHWAKDGEVVVIPQTTPVPTPPVGVAAPTHTPDPSLIQQIFNFLFGS